MKTGELWTNEAGTPGQGNAGTDAEKNRDLRTGWFRTDMDGTTPGQTGRGSSGTDGTGRVRRDGTAPGQTGRDSSGSDGTGQTGRDRRDGTDSLSRGAGSGVAVTSRCPAGAGRS